MLYEPVSCDTLWLPPCPVCSRVFIWKRPIFDILEYPHFRLAVHTTKREGHNYYMLIGCPHTVGITLDNAPRANRLRLAVLWRRRAGRLLEPLFRTGYTEDQRIEVVKRLSLPHQTYSLFEDDAEDLSLPYGQR